MQIITTHISSDFDALASVVAATLLYPDAVPVLPNKVNPNVRAFLSIHREVFSMHSPDGIDLDAVECLVVVDTNRWSRMQGMEKLKQRQDLEIILWDHHTNGADIRPTLDYHEQMGANITLMVRKLKQEGTEISPIQATLFLAGLYEDTGNLTFSTSRADDAYAAAFLLEQKADLKVLNSFLRPAYSKKQKDILFEMLKVAERTKIAGHSVSINYISIAGHVENLAVVVHMYREILNVDAAFGIFFNPERGKCIVIGRSNADAFNVGIIMGRMGGGGHTGAGSAMVDSTNPDEVSQWLFELIKGNQQTSAQVGDLMSFPVISVSPDTPMKQVARIFREKGITGIPVLMEDKPVGVISRRDFRKVKKESQLNAPVKAFMSTKVITIEPGKSPMQLTRLMVKHNIGRLPVVKNGRVIGIVTRSDSMRYIYNLLPE